MTIKANSAIATIAPILLLGSLIGLTYQVLQAFISTVVWAAIIAYAIWPIYRRVRLLCRSQVMLSAFLMSSSLAILLLLSFYSFASLLQEELNRAYQILTLYAASPPYRLPPALLQIPGLQHLSERSLAQLNHYQSSIMPTLLNGFKYLLSHIAHLLGHLGSNLLKLGVLFITLFFCFRDGEYIAQQLETGLQRLIEPYQTVVLQAAANTTRAVIYGLILAALGQGILAWLGYLAVGVPAPLLLGLLTALLALIPMGASFVWLPLSVSLLITGQLTQGLGLLLWGFLAVSTIDNVIRPLVISGLMQVPFLIIMLGVFGGLSAFGAIGLFLGPVVLSVSLAVWHTWLNLAAQTK